MQMSDSWCGMMGVSTNCHLKDRRPVSPLHPIPLLLEALCEFLSASQDSNVCMCVGVCEYILVTVGVNTHM